MPAFDDAGPIVFMDGGCALCTRAACIISRLDSRGVFRICPVQSATGRAVLAHFGLDADDPDSWLFLDRGVAWFSMDAVIRAGLRLGGVARCIAALLLLPGTLREALYRRIAGSRYALFGRADMCAVADPALRARLLHEGAPAPTLLHSALGDRWPDLPAAVRRLHDHGDGRFAGAARVERGATMLARIVAFAFGFPRAGEAISVSVTKTRTATGEVWRRAFAGRVFSSRLTPSSRPGRVLERFGAFTFELELPVADGVMHLPVRRGWFLGAPLPGFLLPRSDAREYAVGERMHFDIRLEAPLGGGLLVHYAGWLAPVAHAENRARAA